MPTSPTPLSASALQLEEARALSMSPDASLSEKERKRIDVLLLLAEGFSNTKIAQRVGLTQARISQIRAKAIREGFGVELRKLKEAVQRRSQSEQKRPHAGRPGRESWELYEQGPDVVGEQYVEIATLLVTGSVQMAVVVTGRVVPADTVENSRSPLSLRADQGLRRRVGQFAAALEEHQEFQAPPWTRVAAFDDICSELFSTLERQFHDLRRSSPGIEWIDAQELVPLGSRFPSADSPFVIWAGEEATAAAVFATLFGERGEYHTFRIPQPEQFSFALAWFVFNCRNYLTGLGAVPSIWEILDAVNSLEAENAPGLLWEGSESIVGQWMRRRFAMRDFYALSGILVEHTANLARKISFSSDASVRTLSCATRVEVKGMSENGHLVISVQPVPEIGYALELPGSAGGKRISKVLREELRHPRSADVRKIRYSPSREALDDQIPALSAILAWMGGNGESASPRSVTLFPRHFLRLDDARDLGNLSWEKNAISVRRSGQERLAILDLSDVHDALWTAFRSNQIEDHVQRLIQRNARIGSHAATRKSSDRLGWVMSFLTLGNETPHFWWLPPDGFAGAKDETTRKRLEQFYRESVIQNLRAQHREDYEAILQRERRVFELLNFAGGNDDEKRAALLKCAQDSAEAEANFVRRHFAEGMEAPIDNEATFHLVLTELDADYLIAHMTVPERLRFQKIVDDWAALCCEWVADEFWARGALKTARLRGLLAPEVNRSVSDADVQDLASEAFMKFGEARKRALRWVIEGAQRSALGGQAPAFVVAEGESDVFRNWRAYVRRFSLRLLSTRKTVSLDEMDDSESDVIQGWGVGGAAAD